MDELTGKELSAIMSQITLYYPCTTCPREPNCRGNNGTSCPKYLAWFNRTWRIIRKQLGKGETNDKREI